MQRLLLFLLFMAFGTGAIVMLSTVQSPTPEPQAITIPLNVLAMRNVVMRQHEGGGLRLVLSARSAVLNERAKTIHLEQVVFRLFEPGKGAPPTPSIEGRADSAQVDQGGGTIVLLGGVRLKDAAGGEIETERIKYEKDLDRFTAPGRVVVRAGGTVHEGRGLVYRIKERTLSLDAPRIYR